MTKHQTPVPVLSNEYINLYERKRDNIVDPKYLLVEIKDHVSKRLYDYIDDWCEENCRDSKKGWLAKRTEQSDFLSAVEKAVKKFETEPEKQDSSSDSDTDDESIQKVLCRRLKTHSKQDIINSTHISDSEEEDVISLCRRMRAIYKQLNTSS
jgi:hypothetical protein